ncbi:PAS domain-containing sensor histidine kinase [Pseudomonas sp. NPDC077408]|tara:strand:- start:761 stop:3130 length:2370 start_codon:yes stop_codon:yes gene_type:complete
MRKTSEARKEFAVALVTPMGAALAAILALASLVAHRSSITLLELIPSETIALSTGLGVLLAAIALPLCCPSSSQTRKTIGRIAATMALVFGLVTVGFYMALAVIPSELETFTITVAPKTQQLSPASGLGLVFISVAIFALSATREELRCWAGPSAAGTLVVALAVLIGRAFGLSVDYGLSSWGGTAISTGTALTALALGVMCADSSRGLVGLLMSGTSAGHLVRRLASACFLASLIVGWLVLWGQKLGLFGFAFGTALLVALLIVLLIGLITRQAAVLQEAEAERERLLGGERDVHRRLIDVLESITDAFFALDRQWCFTYLNHEAERLLHRPREALIGRLIWHEFPGVIGATLMHQVLAMNENEPIQFEEYYPALGVWFDIRIFPNVDGVSVYFRDVTERKHAQEQIRESEARYRLLVDMIPQHIWTTDSEGIYTYHSRQWHEYTGTTPEQAQGQGWLEFVHHDERDAVRIEWQDSLKTGKPFTVELRMIRNDGDHSWFLCQAMPLRNAAGKPTRWFGTLTDISEHKQLEHQRGQLLAFEQIARAEADERHAQLQRVTESRARLIWGFSHDVRNPLSVADSYAWLLEGGRKGQLTSEQCVAVAGIRSAIQTSLRLIEDLLELARAESGELEICPIVCDICATIRHLAEDFCAQALKAKIEPHITLPRRLCVETDPARVEQILANLLSNAIKYAPGSSVTIAAQEYEAGGPRPGRWVGVSVGDTGPGISPDKQVLIFDDYKRLEPDAQQGAGIGLAISLRIARLLGGDLTVESKVGIGSRFTLWLPDPN